MLIIDRKFINEYDMCVFGISTSSGVRPAGRTVDNRQSGRKNHGIVYIESGSVCIRSEGRPDLHAGAGSVVYLPRQLSYILRYEEENTGFLLLNFDLMTSNGEFLAFSRQAEILTEETTDSAIVSLLQRIEQSCMTEELRAVYHRKELVYRLFSYVFGEEHTGRASIHPKYVNIMRGVELMRKTYLQNIPVTDYAKACSISVSSFRSLFTEYYGIPPVQYRNNLRIKRAISLLMDGNYTVAEAAAASGFENPAYFCRLYKRMTGETPGETQARAR